MKTLLPLLGCLLLTTGCQSLDAAEAATVTLRYSDLNVATPTGAKALYKRIQRAANSVCPDYPPGDVRHFRIAVPCYQGALENAVAQVDNPAVNAVHNHNSSATLRTARTSQSSKMRGP